MAKQKVVAQVPANLPNLVFKEDGTIIVKNVWLSYPHLFDAWTKDAVDPKTGKPNAKRFSATGIMPVKTHKAEILALKRYMADLCLEHFEQEIDPAKLALRDGKYQKGEEYKGAWYIATSNTEERPPQTVNRNPKIVVTKGENLLYAGAMVNIMFRIWVQNNTFGQRVNANLLIVQYVDKGEAFGEGAGPAAADAMDDVTSEFPDENEDIGGNGDGGDVDDI